MNRWIFRARSTVSLSSSDNSSIPTAGYKRAIYIAEMVY